ncbi:hypothetical protein P4O66_009844 [Electrophorus voltai]|uniref:Reticulon n=1 Tax=Electrophorus voltai TaxID=2609070 RepID=A0AAD8ZAZ0_9TELE|nr:hypothetical protein P4O66_009844 [Electrophorus voltai]
MDHHTPSTGNELGFLQDECKKEHFTNEFVDEASDFSDTKPFEVDDILDLAGGAMDAIARHRSTLPRTEEPLMDEKAHPEQREEDWGRPDAPPSPDLARTQRVLASPAASQLVDLLYWRDLQRTGVVFGASLFLLLALNACSIISVLSYISLALLSVTISFRIYKGILQAVQKSEDGHPFKMYLDQDVTVPAETVQNYADATLEHVNAAVKELRRLFLVEDLVDSLKFAVLMWILTYVGSLFNGLTILIIVHVAAFSWPVIYEKHQTQIDHYYGLVNNQIKEVMKNPAQ